MRMTSFEEVDNKTSFAILAKDHFAANPQSITYSHSGRPICGELYAIRFGMDNDCVVVFKVDEYEEVVNYQNCIPKTERNTA